jgi:hypothetical protein
MRWLIIRPRECDLETIWKHHIGNPAIRSKYKELLKKLLDSSPKKSE